MPTVDSKLASKFVESPNHRNGRLYPITRITIHHAVMVCNAETIAKVFVPRARSASATYCVGNDGSIVQCVKESDMPWTSSSSDNDNRAITLEVANSSTKYPYPVSDEALAAVIELCADICRRNPGIGRLNYTGDTSGNLTMHKWFANTQCPGPYLAGKFPYIAEEVNKKLGNSGSSTTVKYTLNATGLSQADANNAVAALKAKGYSGTLTERKIQTADSTPASSTDTLKVGDIVKIQKNAPVYGMTRTFSSWVYNKNLYVRAISGNCITVSIYQTGAITGQVDKKYLTKV